MEYGYFDGPALSTCGLLSAAVPCHTSQHGVSICICEIREDLGRDNFSLDVCDLSNSSALQSFGFSA